MEASACSEIVKYDDYIEKVWNSSFDEMRMVDKKRDVDPDKKDEDNVVSRSLVDHESAGCIHVEEDGTVGFCDIVEGGIMQTPISELDLTFPEGTEDVYMVHTHPSGIDADKFSSADLDVHSQMMSLGDEHGIDVHTAIMYNCGAAERGYTKEGEEGNICIKALDHESRGIPFSELWKTSGRDQKKEIMHNYTTECEEEIDVDWEDPVDR